LPTAAAVGKGRVAAPFAFLLETAVANDGGIAKTFRHFCIFSEKIKRKHTI